MRHTKYDIRNTKSESPVTNHESRVRAGSALILTVVLTTLLAIVGVVFVMMARVDKISTSAISENRELGFAVEAVIARISQELALDVPVPRNRPCCLDQEYYDYPDPCNAWLASLEPYLERDPDPSKDKYLWRQISDVTGYLAWRGFATRYVNVDPPDRKYIREYPKIYLDINGELDGGNDMDDGMLGGELRGQLADADGDGIADSKWIVLDNITTSKGKPIYAAIRIVDNQAMANVNTAGTFDPNSIIRERIDGSSQMQINLAGLARFGDDVDEIHTARCGTDGDPNWGAFQDDMIWRTGSPAGGYWPFDISDELELRNRFFLTSLAKTRLEATWNSTIGSETFKRIPYDSDMAGWLAKFDPDSNEPDRRHYLTTYNIDRIIDPNGDKMININEEVPIQYRQDYLRLLYNKLLSSIDPRIVGPVRRQIEARFVQLAVNIIDFADRDDNNNDGILDPDSVTTLVDPCGVTHYGFEAQPFITEIGMKSKPGSIYCAVELYNPFDEAINLRDFEIELIYDEPNGTGDVLTVSFGSGDRIERDGYFVVANVLREFDIYTRTRARQDPRLRFFGHWQPPGGRKPPVVPKPGREPPTITTRPGGDGILFLKRRVVDTVGTEKWIYVDQQVVDPNWVPIKDERYFGRDVRDWHVIYQTLEPAPSTLGISNNIAPTLFADRDHNFSFYLPNPIKPPYHTMEPQTHTKLLTVGDVSRILTIGHGTTPDSTIGQRLFETAKDKEYDIRLDLQNPLYRNIFQYLTVFDPSTDKIDNDNDGLEDANDIIGEFKIPGRININTAPWYVIAQLPWMTEPIAQAIVAYRDKLRLPVDYRQSPTIEPDPCSRQIATGIFGLREDPGFESIGELNFVVAGDNEHRIQRYEPDANDLLGFPDLTTDRLRPGDGVVDDFEERDIIFSRISNLVTVRSDVFTAYILVRIGTDGPQKRVIAILDRSDVYSGNDKVRLVALHYVPDPR